jgi:hypothetical protein
MYLGLTYAVAPVSPNKCRACPRGLLLVVAAEDEREQVTLRVSQRRKAVHHFLDISIQFVIVQTLSVRLP